jgi:hypothetical protein
MTLPPPVSLPARLSRLIACCVLAMSFASTASWAQEAAPAEGEEKEGRVQYQLVLPDEKSPERVRPEENNPFESAFEANARNAPEDTEENRVRNVRERLAVVGASVRPDGKMKVMLGDLMLEPGIVVPPVFQDQQARLHVKNITEKFIELVWEEKEPTGLPPKVMQIAINISPEVKYKLFGGQGATGKIMRGGGKLLKNGQPVPSQPLTKNTIPDRPAPPSSSPAAPDQPATPAPSSTAPGIESAVRMLFGNPVPAAK